MCQCHMPLEIPFKFGLVVTGFYRTLKCSSFSTVPPFMGSEGALTFIGFGANVAFKRFD